VINNIQEMISKCDYFPSFEKYFDYKSDKKFWYYEKGDKLCFLKKWYLPDLFAYVLVVQNQIPRMILNFPGKLAFCLFICIDLFVMVGSSMGGKGTFISYTVGIIIIGILTLLLKLNKNSYKRAFSELLNPLDEIPVEKNSH